MAESDSRTRRCLRALMALIFYLIATLMLAAPLPWHFGSTVARAVRQDVWLNVWALAWTSEHLMTAPLGLFQANIFYPHADTLAYTDHFIGEALLAAPVYWLSGSAVATYNLAWVAALALTAWGGYLWIRALLGDQPAAEAAALVAGAFCLLVPGKRTALSHLQVISLQGVTLSLFATHLLLRAPRFRHAMALSAAALYAGLSSWYTAAYTALLLPMIGIGGLWMVPVPAAERRRIVAWGTLALLLAATLMIPVALPFRAVQQEFAFERPVAELVATSLHPVDFVSSWSWLHAPILPQGSGAGGYFPGFLALLLAVLGIRDGQRRGDRWPLFYALLAAAFALLALGPRGGPGGDVPLPYELLYRGLPGFGALRNPYRAAFFATILLAVPVGYGARRVIERLTRPLRAGRGQPGRARRAAALTWSTAVFLATMHLLEAWPGPQEVAELPQPPSAAYQWLAEQADAATLVWPLPRPLDDNARYQLWTVGGWAPLVNGHSGLYPPDFTRLYRAGDEFPGVGFVALIKERFPVTHVLAHYGLADNGPALRAAAAANGDLEEVWAEADDVIYRIGNGAHGGWLRRRLPGRAIGSRVIVRVAPAAAGCRLRVSLAGRIVGEAAVAAAAGATMPTAAVDLSAGAESRGLYELELWLVDGSGSPRFDVASSLAPVPEGRLEVNGVVAARGEAVVALLSGATGELVFERAVAAEASRVATALRAALERATPGDELLLAVAEGEDVGLIERLRLLLGPIGVSVGNTAARDLAASYVVRGRVGGPAGSAREVLGAEAATLDRDDAAGDCRRAAILGFAFEGAEGGR